MMSCFSCRDVDMIEIDRISGIKYKPSSPPSKETPVRSEINKSCEDMLEKIFEELSERDRDKKSVASESDTLTIKTLDSLEDEHKFIQEKEESGNMKKWPSEDSVASSISEGCSSHLKMLISILLRFLRASFDQETQTETPSSCKKGIKSFCKKLFKKGGKSKKTSS